METSLGDELTGQQLGAYVIERLLGVGGMAHVYQARDTLLGREVAVKALSPGLLVDPGYVERFRREAQRVAALDHPHIAPILHFIEQERGLYLVMPLYTESLREQLEREQRLPLDEAARIVSEIGSALAAAHAHGLIHRDVKPGNILLDESGTAFLCDFGIARQASFKGDPDTLTLAGSGLPVGTPQYMPPEQLRGADLDQRADIYALGVVLYEMLTGRTPHTGNSPFEVAAAALTEPVIPPSRLNPAISPSVEAVILRALSMRAADRYANVMSFVEALQAAQGQHVDEATLRILAPAWRANRPAGQLRPAIASDRERRGWWLTLSLIALAVLLGVGGGVALLSNLMASPHSGGQALQIGGGRPPATATNEVSVNVTASASAITPGAGAGTATPGATPTRTVTPAPSATTPPAPSATLPPPPLLTLGALHLRKGPGKQCSGAQTISNSGAQKIAWQWESAQPGLDPSFAYGVNTSAQFGGLPADLYPGVSSGGADTLNVQMKCTGTTYSVTLRDSFGRAQQFTMTVDH